MTTSDIGLGRAREAASPMRSPFFVTALLVGVIVRAAALPLPGTHDTIPWKIWSYNASREGVSRLYGIGGSPPERRVLSYLGAEATADYPPLALLELGVAGRVYRLIMHGQFPNTTPLYVAVKMPAVLADAGFAVLLYVAVRRRVGEAAARWATIAYWLNPGVVLDGAMLGYLDPQFVLPIGASLVAASAGWSATAGALGAAALLTKPQAAILGPAVVLAVWNGGGKGARGLAAAAAMALFVAALVVGPIVAAGGGPNLLQALGRFGTQDTVSGNACNLWWIIGYALRVQYTIQDYGVWGALTNQTRILQISRFMEVGYPNPRPIGAVLVLAAMAWAAWTARQSRDLWLTAALGAFLIHAYATLSAQVHENHLFAAVPLLAMASAGRPRLRPVLIVVSAILALNLNMFYGISEDVGYAIPRSWTLIDLSVVLSVLNCAALAWHGAVFRREAGVTAGPADECFTAGGRATPPVSPA
jgi:hypothetical protein